MIKTVIFDLGNVIVKVDKKSLHQRLAKESKKSENEIEKYLDGLKERKKFETGKLSAKYFYSKIVADLKIDMDFNEFKSVYCNIFSLDKKVARLIKKLKNNYRLILLSNTDELHFEYIKRKFRIVHIFDDYVLSYEVGCRKPNPLIFLKAIKKAKTSPFNILYFDDIFEFVVVARLMGIKAVQFKNYDTLVEALKD